MERVFRFIASSFLILLLFFVTVNINAQINPDGGFEEATPGTKTGSDITGWSLLLGGSATAEFDIVQDQVIEGDNSLWVEVSNLGTNPWDIQVVNEPFDVEPNMTYTYSIWIVADNDGSVVDFTVGNPSYSEWGRVQETIGTDWKQVTFDFTTPADATTGRAPIHFGESANLGFLPVGYNIDDLEITEATVGVNDKNNIPYKFSLKQNYPNPFNPTTTISFTLPERSDIHLVLVNLLGNIVREIASGSYGAGEHRIKLDASGLSSGIYFYRLEAGSFSSTKKLILLK